MINSIFNWTREKVELSVLFGGAPLLIAMVSVHFLVDQSMIDMTTKKLKMCLNTDPEFTAELLKSSGISLCYIALCIAIIAYFIHLIYKTEGDKKACLIWFCFNVSIGALIWWILYCELEKPITSATSGVIDEIYRKVEKTATSNWTRVGQRNILYYTLRGFGLATVLLGAFTAMMIVASTSTRNGEKIYSPRSLLLHSMIAMTVLLVASTVLIVLSLHNHHPLYEDEAVLEKFDNFADAISVLWGSIFTTILAGIYVPHIFRLQKTISNCKAQHQGRSDSNKQFFQNLQMVLATLAPLIAAILSVFFSDS